MIKSINDIFNEIPPVDLSKTICHSGGALGADTLWETESSKYGTITKAYSYDTNYHKSLNKIEISEEDYQEGIEKINKANYTLKRYGIHKYMNLLSRNWSQVKWSEQIFAIGTIVAPSERGKKYYNRAKYEVVDGGCGYAIQMAIDHNKEVFVFEQVKNCWYYWSFNMMRFLECKEPPIITNLNFTGIGTRSLNKNGEIAIKDILKRTYDKFNEWKWNNPI